MYIPISQRQQVSNIDGYVPVASRSQAVSSTATLQKRKVYLSDKYTPISQLSMTWPTKEEEEPRKTNILSSIINSIKNFISPKAMKFEVGEGLTEKQKKQAEQEVKKKVIPVGKEPQFTPEAKFWAFGEAVRLRKLGEDVPETIAVAANQQVSDLSRMAIVASQGLVKPKPLTSSQKATAIEVGEKGIKQTTLPTTKVVEKAKAIVPKRLTTTKTAAIAEYKTQLNCRP